MGEAPRGGTGIVTGPAADLHRYLQASRDNRLACLVDLYRTAWRQSDEPVEQLGLDAPASVAWWPGERRDTTLGSLLVRVVAETAQHAGHADILRETIDGHAAFDRSDLGDAEWWSRYPRRVQAAADEHRTPA